VPFARDELEGVLRAKHRLTALPFSQRHGVGPIAQDLPRIVATVSSLRERDLRVLA
jgi:hypothetical protein